MTPAQHFTEPPPRFTEASLVKRLEELGIGRPSTYASILSTLQNRNYVKLESKRFVPEDRGPAGHGIPDRVLRPYVQPAFTAALEDKLDSVAAGERRLEARSCASSGIRSRRASTRSRRAGWRT